MDAKLKNVCYSTQEYHKSKKKLIYRKIQIFIFIVKKKYKCCQ